ncbi:hypothetical protein SMGD1_2036 [Sulfurimonas gotlandica GD1]|uniref:Protein containing DUF1887 n=1 Tax=Sulfurimonas gotlandica (strain DSM 19862 / JCM 16533 / GD1) TaxID=929558 RepID=B6BJ44_SULGG|nr:DUF1887 family CARF protein [Sulfurimonas gotlandica]EDZ63474.1 conserved hypothetical protein [Sulfurimonas gotlandica GD1]EHP30559.1 hypothetical protein SMGD1_2036 [Sulfurimonas gotlandica GD1]
MKKVLITWYGITDLRASLSIEYGDGPILSALKAESYTDVLILGYTNKEKGNIEQNIFENDLEKAQSNFISNKQTELWNFINTYSNTDLAHTNFINWVKRELKENKKNTEVSFHSVKLTHLNDTEGIYDIAVQALDIVASWNVEKEVFFYLSPGTPVMAFVWAFAALRQPNLKKNLLVSPIANKKPEIVSLPQEWLDWHSKQIVDSDKHIEEYDILFHLFGEQRMPSLLGVLQFPSQKHVFINSEQYPAKIMKQFIGNSSFDELKINPFDPSDVKEKILTYLQNTSSHQKIGFNLTGGTKLMYAGALAACKKINATPFYFDIIHDKLIFLNDFKNQDIKPITSVETFITLHSNDLSISKKGYWDQIQNINLEGREELTMFLWEHRSNIAKLYRDMIPYVDDRQKFSIQKNTIQIQYTKDYDVTIKIGNKVFTFSNWRDFPVYITGGWFEEYVYIQFKPLLENQIIYDLRIGLEIAFKDKGNQNNSFGLSKLKNIIGDTYQELDIIFTDGKKLYIVECKAGNIKSDHIMKLQNITRYFGGLKGEGILASCFPPNSQVVKKKIADSNNITLLTGRNFNMDMNSIFT